MDKKKGTVRHIFQAGWFAFTNGYFRGYTSGKIYRGDTKALCVPGLNCYSCPGAVGACPIGSLQAVLNNPSYKISLYMIGILSMFGVLFGRLICGWMCPFGLVQDLLYKIKVKGKKKNLPGHNILKYVKYVLLIVTVILLPLLVVNVVGMGQPWFCEWICPSGMLLGGIPLTIMNKGFQAAIGIRFAWKMVILVVSVLLSVWFYRPFCKYLCPLGAIYGFFNSFSTYRLEVDEEKCIKCGACQKACGMDIKTWQTPNSMDCIRCGDCMRACPKDAISSTWGKAREKVSQRCFLDDSGVDFKANPLERNVVFLSVLAVITAVCSIFSATNSGIMFHVWFRNASDQAAAAGGYQYIIPILILFASVLLLYAGIYGIRYRRDSARIVSVGEKIGVAFFFGILFLPAGFIISGVFGENAFAELVGLNSRMLAGLFAFIIPVPLFILIDVILNMSIEGDGKIKPVQAAVLFVLYAVAILAVLSVILLTIENIRMY